MDILSWNRVHVGFGLGTIPSSPHFCIVTTCLSSEAFVRAMAQTRGHLLGVEQNVKQAVESFRK